VRVAKKPTTISVAGDMKKVESGGARLSSRDDMDQDIPFAPEIR
jgi:hypothetical protein